MAYCSGCGAHKSEYPIVLQENFPGARVPRIDQYHDDYHYLVVDRLYPDQHLYAISYHLQVDIILTSPSRMSTSQSLLGRL